MGPGHCPTIAFPISSSRATSQFPRLQSRPICHLLRLIMISRRASSICSFARRITLEMEWPSISLLTTSLPFWGVRALSTISKKPSTRNGPSAGHPTSSRVLLKKACLSTPVVSVVPSLLLISTQTRTSRLADRSSPRFLPKRDAPSFLPSRSMRIGQRQCSKLARLMGSLSPLLFSPSAMLFGRGCARTEANCRCKLFPMLAGRQRD